MGPPLGSLTSSTGASSTFESICWTSGASKLISSLHSSLSSSFPSFPPRSFSEKKRASAESLLWSRPFQANIFGISFDSTDTHLFSSGLDGLVHRYDLSRLGSSATPAAPEGPDRTVHINDVSSGLSVFMNERRSFAIEAERLISSLPFSRQFEVSALILRIRIYYWSQGELSLSFSFDELSRSSLSVLVSS